MRPDKIRRFVENAREWQLDISGTFHDGGDFIGPVTWVGASYFEMVLEGEPESVQFEDIRWIGFALPA